MNNTETTRQRNARLRRDISAAKAVQAGADADYREARNAAHASPESADWEVVYSLEEAAHRAEWNLDGALSEYTLRDVPQATRDLVAQNID